MRPLSVLVISSKNQCVNFVKIYPEILKLKTQKMRKSWPKIKKGHFLPWPFDTRSGKCVQIETSSSFMNDLILNIKLACFNQVDEMNFKF